MSSTTTLENTCPQGHALQFFLSPQAGFTCDHCQKVQDALSEMSGCRQCDYDLCFGCAKRTAKVLCSQGHAAQLISVGLSSSGHEFHCCNRCDRKDILAPEQIYRCCCCDYDICLNCVGVEVAPTPRQVPLLVTPGLDVPSERLPTTSLARVLQALANNESEKGLVDEGGVFNYHKDATLLSNVHPHGFIAAATSAFANHYPLAIRPQHFWMMILQATAVHVDKNAEEVRANWVAHEGKKELEVRCDEFSVGARNNWASVVDGKPDCFSVQIDQNVVEGLAAELSPAFSETSPEENIALKITIMDITKSFFSFKCFTYCGFPSVLMEGTLDDWRLLRHNAELLIAGRCEQTFAKSWCVALLPLLDMLVDEYSKGLSGGSPDEPFWNSMCKRGGTSGSGARTWFNGWFNIFFPYIIPYQSLTGAMSNGENRYMVPYSKDNGYVKEGRNGGYYTRYLTEVEGAPAGVQGPDCADFPGGLAAAPVVWDYYGKEMKLKFKAGFVGAEQDSVTGVIRPIVGWFIAHDGGHGGTKGKGK